MCSNLIFMEISKEFLPVMKSSLVDYHSAELQKVMLLSEEAAHNITQGQIQMLDNIDRQSDNHQYLVSAQYDGKMIGGAWYSAVPHQAAVLLWFFIDEKYQNRGFGKRLMQHIMDNCKNMEASGFALHVFSHNEKAIKLYQYFGLQEVGKEMYINWSASSR
ncbi:GNAT family N-acetyltransferase [Acidithiobacillus sp. HP-6]|uniref:GNAT family N-acetyltransferase n=1 Tax=unclassified Acidithiobacillus TaxID=2614800 RepID=UPI00187A6C25|nr:MULTISPECIES: GNAT family N-acetyltransferase [unclassified Acidithiobacillus]MBE7564397.1 GNAT family N-acetyltransferase [Acidithiobacillus sp. HP-6]MBE7568721.1 GNAT family N-acetyltransferase [Acidithiobacillus sp. HP-2]